MKFHQRLAIALFFPFLLTALTGVGHRIGRSWLGLPKSFGRAMMTLHEGRFLGESLIPVYVLVLGLGLLAMIASGFLLFFQRPTPGLFTARKIHHLIAPIAALPLIVSGITGISYRLGRAWFGLSKEQAAIFLSIHQGTYLGPTLRPFYILLIGLGAIAILLSGVQLIPEVRQHLILPLRKIGKRFKNSTVDENPT
ncbi:hypothetical protein L3556_00645 [Candidatus Synechococcus calcipolaris G9]|uniref:PepSY domain-containing protein n=1 Tax=Candidatus Synechococcus calcipolaris G9 TaxID=1497997 RepID=A0ABT6EU77_9SYNE|nr:hypothetical protein [Candidatus Synechococcus calcipolaris]MDG2989445.1 hypothetical protein [Candidatus Synechococcus calcipolaris G9]